MGFSTLNGIFNYFGALLNFLIKPLGYNDVIFLFIKDQISNFGISFIMIGLISAFALSLYV
jgi:hypothetical protein